jgi:hypothetical protein
MLRTLVPVVLAALLGVPGVRAAVIDCGVGGKAKIFDRLLSVGTARVNYRSTRVPCIQKGAAGSTSQISGTFDVLYIDTPGSVQGAFVMPAPWYVNIDGKATFVNTSAPSGPSEARRVGVKNEKLAKFGSRGLGDTSDINITNPPGPSGVLAILSVQNAVDGNTYRLCTRWSLAAGSAIRHEIVDGGLGRKLFLDRGVVASCNVVPTTTSTSTSLTTTTSTSNTTTTSTSSSTTTSTSTSSTTTTSLPPSGTTLRFVTTVGAGDCGDLKAGGVGGTLLANITCGLLYLGGGDSSLPAGATPSGSTTIFNSSCASGTCTLSATTSGAVGANSCSSAGTITATACVSPPAVNNATCTTPHGATATCAADGFCHIPACYFGSKLPIVNGGLSTCVTNSFRTNATGSVNSTTGAGSMVVDLFSQPSVTGNAAAPCPLCVTSPCAAPAANPGTACVATNATGNNYECIAATGSSLGEFQVNLGSASTAGSSFSAGGGMFCPGQVNAGAFGFGGSTAPTTVADYIQVNGVAAGTLSPGTHAMTAGTTFCIPATGNFLVDGSTDLPGPGATALVGTWQLVP